MIQHLVDLRTGTGTAPSAPPAHFLKRALKLVAAGTDAVYVRCVRALAGLRVLCLTVVVETKPRTAAGS